MTHTVKETRPYNRWWPRMHNALIVNFLIQHILKLLDDCSITPWAMSNMLKWHHLHKVAESNGKTCNVKLEKVTKRLMFLCSPHMFHRFVIQCDRATREEETWSKWTIIPWEKSLWKHLQSSFDFNNYFQLAGGFVDYKEYKYYDGATLNIALACSCSNLFP